MKKTLLLLFASLCVASFALPALAAHKNEPVGFRGIPWYASPKDKLGFKKWGLSELGRDTVVTTYTREKEQLSLGGAAIDTVHYLFLDEVGLVMVNVIIKGQANFDHIKKVCTVNWGEPVVEEMFAVWKWDTIMAQMYGYVNDTGVLKTGVLKICLSNFSELLEQQEKKAIQKSQKDFQKDF